MKASAMNKEGSFNYSKQRKHPFRATQHKDTTYSLQRFLVVFLGMHAIAPVCLRSHIGDHVLAKWSLKAAEIGS